MHHYLTKYRANGNLYVTAWFQINVLGKKFCLWKRTIEIKDAPAE
jgi:hypothetical protein